MIDLNLKESLSATPIVNTTKVTDVKYYVSAKDTASVCESERSLLSIKILSSPDKPAIVRDASGNLVSSSSTGNQWYKEGESISNANTQIYKPILSGYYTVKVLSDGGCSSLLSDKY